MRSNLPSNHLNQKGAAPLLVLVAMVGVLGFLALSSTFPFKSSLLSTLFPKDSSQAAGITVVTEAESAAKAGSAVTGSDAGASGGQYLQFNLPAGVQTFNVKTQYGAVGNGTANDTAAFQNAFNAAAAANPKGVVIVPPGTYYINATVRPNGAEVLGYGGGQSIITVKDNGVQSMSMSSDSKIRGLKFLGPNITNSFCHETHIGSAALAGGNGTNAFIEDNEVSGFNCMGMNLANDSFDNIIVYNHIHDNWNEGVLVNDRSMNNWVERNNIHDNQFNAIDFTGSNNKARFNILDRNGLFDLTHVWGSDVNAVVIYNASPQIADNNLIEGNIMRGNVVAGVQVQGGAGVLTGNIIRNNLIEGGKASSVEIAGKSTQTQVVDNILRDNAKWGILLKSTTNNNTIRGNVISNNGPKTNCCDGLGFFLLNIDGGPPSNNLIDNNYVFNHQNAAALVDGGSTNNTFSNNKMWNNTGGQFIDNGTGTVKTNNSSTAVTPPNIIIPTNSTTCPTNWPQDKGVATLTVNVPSTGNYKIWSRVKGTNDISNSYYIQIDNYCPEMVSNSGAVGAWTWQDFKAGDSNLKNTWDFSAGSHTIKLIGRETGLQIDKLMLTTDSACTPTGDGTNCSGANPSPSTNPSPSSAQTISGVPSSVAPGAALTINFANIANATATDWFGLYAPGVANEDTPYYYYTNSCTQTDGTTVRSSGTCSITAPAEANSYQLKLFSNNTYNLLATGNTLTVAASPSPSPSPTPLPSGVIVVEDSVQGTGLNQFNYQGSGWDHDAVNSWNETVNETVTLSFTGTRIKLYAFKDAHHGIEAVSIDSGAETMIDLYSATRQEGALVYTSPVLTAGTHTIKVRVTGTKNASSTGTVITVDKVEITTSAAASPSPSSSPSPSTKPGDIDGNGRVDIFDYNILLTNFGKTGTGIQGDLDNNNRVDIFDYNILLTNFGK